MGSADSVLTTAHFSSLLKAVMIGGEGGVPNICVFLQRLLVNHWKCLRTTKEFKILFLKQKCQNCLLWSFVFFCWRYLCPRFSTRFLDAFGKHYRVS